MHSITLGVDVQPSNNGALKGVTDPIYFFGAGWGGSYATWGNWTRSSHGCLGSERKFRFGNLKKIFSHKKWVEQSQNPCCLGYIKGMMFLPFVEGIMKSPSWESDFEPSSIAWDVMFFFCKTWGAPKKKHTHTHTHFNKINLKWSWYQWKQQTENNRYDISHT